MSAMDEKLAPQVGVSFQDLQKKQSPLLTLDECDLKNRLQIEQALQARVSNIPAQFKQYFYDHLYQQNYQNVRHMIYLAQIAFLIYFVADAFILPDLFFISGGIRVATILLSMSCCYYLFKNVKDIRILDMILPVSSTVCAGAWIGLLTLSTSPYVNTYIYASCIFVLIANLSVYIQFRLSLYCSALISLFILLGISQIMSGAEAFIFAVVYLPVLFFSIYMNWTNTINTRRHFLRTLLDEWNYHTLKHLAHTDELTQLYNRRHFVNLAEHAIREWPKSENTSLLMFDVDHFKQINDSYGHDMGDRVLQVIAETARKEMRQSDVLARFGGEEFVVLLNNTHIDDAMMIAERLRNSIATQYLYIKPHQTLRFTISLGVAELESHLQPLNDLIKNADIALYEAKARGRNQVVLFQEAHLQSQPVSERVQETHTFKNQSKKIQYELHAKPL